MRLRPDAVGGIQKFHDDILTWRRAHSRPRFAMPKRLIRDDGKAALGTMLIRLHMYQSTADGLVCREYYEELSSVEGTSREPTPYPGKHSDAIAESIFENGAELVQDPDFGSLADEIDLADVEEPFLQAALISKDTEERIHRLVQALGLRRLNDADRRKCFTVAISLLSLGFPETWSKDVGHQKQQWSRCEQYLPHVNALVQHGRENNSLAENPDVWAELLLRCSWYLYEKEQYTYARTFTQTALRNFTSQETLAYASAIDLLGLIDLDLNNPLQALSSFETGFSVRRSLLAPTDPLIAFALNNLALVRTELAELSEAEQLHQQAIQLRLQNNSDRIGNSYSNYAVALLRMGKPNEAERILMSCPSLQGCTDETFLQVDNPRFVGDMVLLSRIRHAQGRKGDALRLASKALAWRQKVHGDRYKTCDSMYDVAFLLREQGQTATALDLLDALTRIAGALEAGEGHMARAEWKTSQILEAMGRSDDSRTHLEKAEALRKAFRTNAGDGITNESDWERLTPYMLW
ncbi:hypothetical protein H2200_010102 [Cladophialophora chaetospira]|uniref:MalT-like TPR region domain-containing protein n=1 Tax=Cladophialophora chaetospira TaxID=386627 RepID=A0AA38X286_9EURO|nr:hypothetical protein H2200_010102 [Cladophialophora chaetospira]